MIIKVSQDLKTQEIYANGAELANMMGKDMKNGKRVLSYPLDKKQHVWTLKNPILLTDNYRISKLSPTIRDTIFALYTSRPRIVEYDSVSVLWDRSHVSVWCPSIDTLLFAKALKRVLNKNLKTAIEIGTGSGFLSKFILKKSKIKSIIINDLNPYAIKCAKDNIKDKRAEFFIGDGLKKIKNKKFDLIICNPPYVPRQKSIDDNPYEGIELLNYLVHKGQEHLNKKGILITNISSLCWNFILKEKPKMKLTILEKMKVPLKVNNILNNKKWISYLEKIGLKRNLKDGYEYWQEIYIVMLEN